MFCTNCGKEYKEGENSCSSCGIKKETGESENVTGGNHVNFYEIKPTNLVLLSFFTLWFFEFYWFYKQWKSIRVQDSKSPNPLLGTIFFPIAAYGLFKRILVSAKAKGYQKSYPAGWLAVGFLSLLTLEDSYGHQKCCSMQTRAAGGYFL